jgi:hypothetical protein
MSNHGHSHDHGDHGHSHDHGAHGHSHGEKKTPTTKTSAGTVVIGFDDIQVCVFTLFVRFYNSNCLLALATSTSTTDRHVHMQCVSTLPHL